MEGKLFLQLWCNYDLSGSSDHHDFEPMGRIALLALDRLILIKSLCPRFDSLKY